MLFTRRLTLAAQQQQLDALEARLATLESQQAPRTASGALPWAWLLLLGATFAAAQTGGGSDLSWWTVDGGGGTLTGGGYTLRGGFWGDVGGTDDQPPRPPGPDDVTLYLPLVIQ